MRQKNTNPFFRADRDMTFEAFKYCVIAILNIEFWRIINRKALLFQNNVWVNFSILLLKFDG